MADFPLPDVTYARSTALAKVGRLQRAMRATYQALGRALPNDWPRASEVKDSLVDTDETAQAFLRTGDFSREPRRKRIHTFGSAARVQFHPSPRVEPYGGVLSERTLGVLRVSYAFEPGKPPKDWRPYLPGLALKLLIDRHPSVDLLFLSNAEGVDEDRPLALGYSTRVDTPVPGRVRQVAEIAGRTLEYLGAGMTDPLKLPNDHAARRRADGSPSRNLGAPATIAWTTEQPWVDAWDAAHALDFRDRLAEIGASLIPPGGLSPLATLYDEKGSAFGTVLAESTFYAGPFVDDHLQFTHPHLPGAR